MHWARSKRQVAASEPPTTSAAVLIELAQDISRLLSLAASSISLLALPQTDDAERPLPQGEERSEQFVLEVSEYFERLEVRSSSICQTQTYIRPQSIQHAMRSSLAHIRQARVAPTAINAPAMGTVPAALGVGLPSIDTEAARRTRGLQEERVERDAWTGIVDALKRLKAARDAEAAAAMLTE